MPSPQELKNLIKEKGIESFKGKDFEKEIDKLTGYKPNSWQRRVRAVDSRFKVICAGRRSGKTYYVANDSIDGVVVDLLLPMQHVWIVAPNYDLTQRVWSEVYNVVISKFKPMIQRIHNSKGNYRIETFLGTIIEAKSAEEEEKLVGVGLTKIIIDEAALVKEKAWTQSLRPTLLDHKGKAIFISTPKGKNWFWELYMKGEDKEDLDWKSWRFTTYENEHIERVEIDKIVADMPEYEYRQEILATFEETAEQIFRRYREQAIGKITEPKKKHRYQIGVDLGRKSSYSAIIVVDEMTWPYEVVYMDRFKTIDWNLQVERIKAVYEKYPCMRMRVDATGLGDPVVEDLEKRGVRVEPFIFQEVPRKQMIDKLSIFIEDGRIIYPNDKQLIKELETFGREINLDSGRVKYKPLKGTADYVMALSLACLGLRDKPRKLIEDRLPADYKPKSSITGY